MKINIFNHRVLFYTLNLLVMVQIKSNSMLGGHEKVDIKICQPILLESENALKMNGYSLYQLELVNCHTQVVAGTNYIFQLKLPDGRICTMKVYQKLPDQNGRMNLEINQRESTCLKPEFKSKNDTTYKNDNGSPMLKTGWMFASLLVFFVSLI